MIFRSIRWRLQVWQGLLLLAVVAGFSIAVWRLQRANVHRQVDKELDLRAAELLGAFRRSGPPRDGPPPEGRPPDGPQGAERGPGGPARGQNDSSADRPPPPKLRLPLPVTRLFEATPAPSYYYLAWSRDGSVFGRSTNAPADVPRPANPVADRPPVSRMRGDIREAFVSTPPGEILLVGRSVAGEQAELRGFAGWLAAVGTGVLVTGLVGGWWLITRAIRPIGTISATAGRIAAGNLSERIDAAGTDDELGRLAGVLNTTFGRLEAAFERQRQFTADASHELRTPVSVILSQVQTTLARERSAAEYRDTLAACQRAAQRMRRLIETLLELARLDAGQETMRREPFDLAEVAREALELVGPLAAERGITLHADKAPSW